MLFLTKRTMTLALLLSSLTISSAKAVTNEQLIAGCVGLGGALLGYVTHFHNIDSTEKNKSTITRVLDATKQTANGTYQVAANAINNKYTKMAVTAVSLPILFLYRSEIVAHSGSAATSLLNKVKS